MAGLLLALVLALGTGCGTMNNHWYDNPKPYGGVCYDGLFIYEGVTGQNLPSGAEQVMFGLGGIIDFPFSLAADTICLPYDIYAVSSR